MIKLYNVGAGKNLKMHIKIIEFIYIKLKLIMLINMKMIFKFRLNY